MFDWLFGKKNKDWVGIDLGASAIKVVEIKKTAERLVLNNYALLQIGDGEGVSASTQGLPLPGSPQGQSLPSALGSLRSGQAELSNAEIAANLKTLFERAGIASRHVNISLPIGKTFSTIVEFPMMSDAELAAAVPFEARKYIPVPMEEVALDWSIIGEIAEQERGLRHAEAEAKPASALSGYGEAKADGVNSKLNSPQPSLESREGVPPSDLGPSSSFPPLNLRGGEGELNQVSTPSQPVKDQAPSAPQAGLGPSARLQVLLVAVPKEIIDKLTEIAALAGLQINSMEQEAFSLARSLVGNDKNTFLVVDIGRKSSDIVVVDGGFVRLSHNFESVNKEVLLMEIDRLVNVFKVKYNRDIGACLLTGGRAQEKELFEFLAAKLKLPVAMGNPFARLEFPPALEPAIKELGSMLSVAAGLAMRES